MKALLFCIVFVGSILLLFRPFLHGSIAKKPDPKPAFSDVDIELTFTYADIDADGLPMPRFTLRVPDHAVGAYLPPDVRRMFTEEEKKKYCIK